MRLIALCIVLLLSNILLAHDVGVTNVNLYEKKQGLYLVVANVPASLAPLLSPPEIPAHCQYQKNDSNITLPSKKIRYFIQCNGSLGINDQLIFPWDREGIMLVSDWQNGTRIQRLFTRQSQGIVVPISMARGGVLSLTQSAALYTRLGIEHILNGFDHLLFVLGLIMLVNGGRKLFLCITAFTLAHSITLACAALDYIAFNSSTVEALIALSLVFMGVEVIRVNRGEKGLAVKFPWIIAFCFGLLHGFGFASALSDLGLTQQAIPLALLFFNIGVEVGQLIFVTIILTVIAMWRYCDFPRPKWLKLAPAYMVGISGAVWFIQRTQWLWQIA